MTNYTFLIYCSILFFVTKTEVSDAQKQAFYFEVETPVSTRGWGMPVSASLDSLKGLTLDNLVLTDVTQKPETVVPFQITGDKKRTLHWLVQGTKAGQKRTFKLANAGSVGFSTVKTVKTDNAITIRADDKDIVNYFFKSPPLPDTVDKAYERSGFIHPLYTPDGKILTRIQPADHYHHYGIWSAWTHVLFEKDTIDFWNLKDRKGLVRFAKLNSVTEGVVFGEFEVLQEHIVTKGGKNKVALNEVQTVRVYRPSSDTYIMDITHKFTCATPSPFKILTYRYAGLGWRGSEFWNNTNSEVLTSEGKSRRDADGTKARWWFAQGKLESDYGGAAVLSHPDNYNHPEPVRIWPENQYERGDFFGMFAPTKDKDWLMEAGKTYTLKYRWVVSRSPLTRSKVDAVWSAWDVQPKLVSK
jgi:Methane oxygenase PmoA